MEAGGRMGSGTATMAIIVSRLGRLELEPSADFRSSLRLPSDGDLYV